MIQSLQSWRFVFAIFIFLHHFSITSGESLFKAGGSCGVSFFLILSGFVLTMGYESIVKDNKFNYRSFILKRFIRLYPLHLLCLLGFVLIKSFGHASINYESLIPNVLLLQSFIPIKEIYFSGNALSWCLSDLLFFYACFPFIIRFINRKRVNTIFLVSLISLCSYVCLLVFLPNRLVHSILYVNPIVRLFDFIIGIFLYKGYQYLLKRLNKQVMSFHICTILEVVVVMLLIIFIALYNYVPDRFALQSYFWLPISCILIIFSLSANYDGGGCIAHIINNKFFITMGQVSFIFYMIHQLAFISMDGLLFKFNFSLFWQIKILVYFIIVCLSALFIYHYYETPINKYLSRKLL